MTGWEGQYKACGRRWQLQALCMHSTEREMCASTIHITKTWHEVAKLMTRKPSDYETYVSIRQQLLDRFYAALDYETGKRDS